MEVAGSERRLDPEGQLGMRVQGLGFRACSFILLHRTTVNGAEGSRHTDNDTFKPYMLHT